MQLSLKTRQILLHILENDSITPLEAQHLYREMRLAARIHEARQAGHKIVTNIKRDALGSRYAKYTMDEAFEVAA